MKKRLPRRQAAQNQFDFDLYPRRATSPSAWLAKPSASSTSDPKGRRAHHLFQHGYAGVLESWEFQINHFARNYRVVAPDLRGHGQSDAPYTQYTMPELVSDIQAIVEALELPEIHLVAHSFGGSIAVEYANAYPSGWKTGSHRHRGGVPLPRFAHLLLRLPLIFCGRCGVSVTVGMPNFTWSNG
ncbi:MAG: alpha/beta fold hydrolase [Chloroflexi bacterium]|nr:alpha/beta fold hydrolase [Chloroflexota bacterium]